MNFLCGVAEVFGVALIEMVDKALVVGILILIVLLVA